MVGSPRSGWLLRDRALSAVLWRILLPLEISDVRVLFSLISVLPALSPFSLQTSEEVEEPPTPVGIPRGGARERVSRPTLLVEPDLPNRDNDKEERGGGEGESRS